MLPTPIRTFSTDIPVYGYTDADGNEQEFALDLELWDDKTIRIERAKLSETQAETVAAWLDNVGAPVEYGDKAVALSIEVGEDGDVNSLEVTLRQDGGLDFRQQFSGSTRELVRIPGGDPSAAAIAFIQGPDAFKDGLQS
mgnify:FL=1